MTLNVHRHLKADGRELLLYGHAPFEGEAGHEHADAGGAPSHMRWHPLRREWVVYAAARQGRTFLPNVQDCPLCPTRDGTSGEVPFSAFEIAVFENRFPAFTETKIEPSQARGVELAAAQGRCEVIVYSADHHASLATLPAERLVLLIEVWGARVRDMRERGYPCILPFENRGEEIGVTLHHPHGQLYAFPFVPAQLRRAAEAQADRPVMASLIESLDPALILHNEPEVLSFVPPFAMFPYEVWLTPRRRVSSPEFLSEGERHAMARGLRDAMRRLDGLFSKPMPYILTVQAAPAGFEESFHMAIEIRPFRRDAGKLKFLAGVEQGAGIFLVDVLPEAAAQRLRSVPI